MMTHQPEVAAPCASPDIPAGPMSVRAACKALGGRSAYQVMKLLGAGELEGQTVHNAAGGSSLQVIGSSVQAYLDRQRAAGTGL